MARLLRTHRSRPLLAVVTALALVLTGACGGDDDPELADEGTSTNALDDAKDVDDAKGGTDDGDDASGARTGTGGGSSTIPGKGGEPSATSAPAGGSDGATSTTAPFTPPTDPSKPPLRMEAELKEDCVVAGGRQTITLESEPKAAVGYDSVYPDGKSGMSEGFYGGNNGTPMPESGTWTDSWVINPAAPPGTVVIRILGRNLAGNTAYLERSFKLVRPGTSCS